MDSEYGNERMEPFRNKEDCIINGRVPGPVKAKIEVTSLQLDHGRVHIRLDAGNVPEFWLEMNICATALLDLIKPNEEDDEGNHNHEYLATFPKKLEELKRRCQQSQE